MCTLANQADNHVAEGAIIYDGKVNSIVAYDSVRNDIPFSYTCSDLGNTQMSKGVKAALLEQ